MRGYIYKYKCKKCQETFEAFRWREDKYKINCPKCDNDNVIILPFPGGKKVPTFGSEPPIGEFPGDDDYKETKKKGWGWTP